MTGMQQSTRRLTEHLWQGVESNQLTEGCHVYTRSPFARSPSSSRRLGISQRMEPLKVSSSGSSHESDSSCNSAFEKSLNESSYLLLGRLVALLHRWNLWQ